MRRCLLGLMVAMLACPAAAQQPDTPCAALPPGMAARQAAGKPLAWNGDFNRDGLPDTAEFVSLGPGFKVPPGVALANPWDKVPARVSAKGEPLALLVTHGGRQSGCVRFLLVHRDFFATPIWSAFAAGEPGLANVSVVASGSKAHAGWRRQVRALGGDGIVLATEAGIDILLYWKASGYVVFWPEEEP